MSLVTIKLDGMQAVEHLLDPKRVRRIRWSAMNEAVRSGRTLFSREVRTVLAAPAKIVNESFSTTRAVGENGFAEISVRRKPIPLKYFRPMQNKVGVSVLVRKDQGRRTVKGAFGPKIDKFYGRVVKRAPIGGPDDPEFKEQYGQTAASIAANSPGLLPRVSKRIADTLQARYASKLNYVLATPSATGI